MRSSPPKSCDSLLERVERERATFDDEKVPLLSYQASAFISSYDLLREDAVSLAKRSKQRRSERLRARTLLVDVFTGVSPEVFLLCVITTPITKLEKIPPKDIIPMLRVWWRAAPHPRGLTAVATELCDTNSIRTLISSYQQIQLSETSTDTGMSNMFLSMIVLIRLRLPSAYADSFSRIESGWKQGG
ncbi:hypothetical protein DM02DRAFT_530790 [Periconia macrospinosa]|uniref:Uncharacterized protein n=1 Tax=Periconia macrospinosa TaxID=97972 RepID=A0A2V1DKC5_9PLEO|nr:hypothetical protein DM02DRAFT_530790 [Periconia macrospinosa]